MTAWTPDDLRGTARAVQPWWELLTAGVDAALLVTPAAGGPGLAALRARSEERLAAAGPQDADAVEQALADLSLAGRTLAALGAGSPPGRGTLAGVQVSGGGVPKHPVPSARVGERGLEGDRQAARKHHGRVWQALCLWSLDVIQALRAEGHHLAPGYAGENLTLAGVDWAGLRPGTRLLVGDVLAEVSVPALPCKKNARWFVDGQFMRMWHGHHPGQTRWYASVLTPGTVRVGDPVVVEP